MFDHMLQSKSDPADPGESKTNGMVCCLLHHPQCVQYLACVESSVVSLEVDLLDSVDSQSSSSAFGLMT